MEDLWLSKIKRLHAIAETGLAFSKDDYDIERYEEVAQLARQMLADLTSVPINSLESVLKLDDRVYVTPQIDVRGALIHEHKILLVQEKMDQLWTLPGGYADTGLSATENVEKEMFEEACIRVEAQQLYALRHKAKGEYDPDIRDFYKLFFVCRAIGDIQVNVGPETMDVGFFGLDNLPPLSTGRVIKRDIVDAFNAFENRSSLTLFD